MPDWLPDPLRSWPPVSKPVQYVLLLARKISECKASPGRCININAELQNNRIVTTKPKTLKPSPNSAQYGPNGAQYSPNSAQYGPNSAQYGINLNIRHLTILSVRKPGTTILSVKTPGTTILSRGVTSLAAAPPRLLSGWWTACTAL